MKFHLFIKGYRGKKIYLRVQCSQILIEVNVIVN